MPSTPPTFVPPTVGRPVGNNWFGQHDANAVQPKETPHEDDLMNVVIDLKSQLRVKNEELFSKSDQNQKLTNELERYIENLDLANTVKE